MVAKSIIAARSSPKRSPKRSPRSRPNSNTSNVPPDDTSSTPMAEEIISPLPHVNRSSTLDVPPDEGSSASAHVYDSALEPADELIVEDPQMIAKPPTASMDNSRDTVESLLLLSSTPVSSFTLAEESSCPSITFAKSLKTYGQVTYRPQSSNSKTLEVKAVIGFNLDMYTQKCNQVSPDYDDSLDLDKIAGEVFKESEIWAHRNLAFDVLKAQAGMYFFALNRT